MKEEAAKEADPESLTNRNIVLDQNKRVSSQNKKNEEVVESEQVKVEFVAENE